MVVMMVMMLMMMVMMLMMMVMMVMDKPEEQQSWQVESVSLTPQHSAARPRRVMYDLKTGL